MRFWLLILIKLNIFLKVDVDINPNQKFCTLIDFGKNDPVNFSIIDFNIRKKSKYFIFIETLKNEVLIEESSNKHSISYNFKKYGKYNFCVRNLENKKITVTKFIKYGIYIGDSSKAVKNKNTNKLVDIVDKIINKASKIKTLHTISHENSIKNNKINKIMGNKIVFIGILMSIILIIMLFIQLFITKSTIKGKKFN